MNDLSIFHFTDTFKVVDMNDSGDPNVRGEHKWPIYTTFGGSGGSTRVFLSYESALALSRALRVACEPTP